MPCSKAAAAIQQGLPDKAGLLDGHAKHVSMQGVDGNSNPLHSMRPGTSW
jgi:hypothetical protein